MENQVIANGADTADVAGSYSIDSMQELIGQVEEQLSVLEQLGDLNCSRLRQKLKANVNRARVSMYDSPVLTSFQRQQAVKGGPNPNFTPAVALVALSGFVLGLLVAR